MRTWFISLALLAAVLLVSTAAFAGDKERAGSTGATELRIPVGARALGVGGAVVSEVAGVNALYWNPAGLAHLDSPEFQYSYTSYFAEMDHNWLAYGAPVGGGQIGASLKMLSIGDIIVTDENAPNGTGEIVSPTFGSMGVTYARPLTDRVLVGGTMNLIYEKVLQQQAIGFGFDFGFQYLLGAQGLQFGLAIKNLGPNMEFSGGDFDQSFVPSEQDPIAKPRTFTSQSTRFELPSYVSLGVSYRLIDAERSTLMLMGDFQSNSFSGDEFRGGGEFAFRAGRSGRTELAIRGGWNQADQDDFMFSGGAIGVGVGLPVGESDLQLDYTRNFLGGDAGSLFDDLNTVTISYVF